MTPDELRALAERLRMYGDSAFAMGAWPTASKTMHESSAALTEAAQEIDRLRSVVRNSTERDERINLILRRYRTTDSNVIQDVEMLAEAAERRVAELEKDATRWGAMWDRVLQCPHCNEAHPQHKEIAADARRYVAEGNSPERVANMMGISVATVHAAMKGTP